MSLLCLNFQKLPASLGVKAKVLTRSYWVCWGCSELTLPQHLQPRQGFPAMPGPTFHSLTSPPSGIPRCLLHLPQVNNSLRSIQMRSSAPSGLYPNASFTSFGSTQMSSRWGPLWPCISSNPFESLLLPYFLYCLLSVSPTSMLVLWGQRIVSGLCIATSPNPEKQLTMIIMQ